MAAPDLCSFYGSYLLTFNYFLFILLKNYNHFDKIREKKRLKHSIQLKRYFFIIEKRIFRLRNANSNYKTKGQL